MYCEICKSLKTEDKSELLTFSARAYAQVVSILKISKNNPAEEINEENSCMSVCIKCLQGF